MNTGYVIAFVLWTLAIAGVTLEIAKGLCR
jgi:hypothetical protein